MRVLVTGGAGFIGSPYARTILAGPDRAITRVTVLNGLTYSGDRAWWEPLRGVPVGPASGTGRP